MNYVYWVGIAIIMSFVSYVVVDGLVRYLDYIIEKEND